MKKILIFGGSGFLGSHVADKLSQAGHKVTVFDKNKSNHLIDTQKVIVGDILSENEVDKAVSNSDIVFNFAGISDIDQIKDNSIASVKHNILGNTIILEACKKHKIQRFIFASTVYVYSGSGGFYKVSKQACENYIENYYKTYGLQYTILRFGSLYGPRSDKRNGIYRFINQALTERKMTFYGEPDSLREFIHVEDAASCTLEILKPEYANQHIILTGQQLLKINELLEMIKEILNDKDIKIEYKQDVKNSHYRMTPYNYNPKYGKKMTPNLHIDLGQGLLQMIDQINKSDKVEDSNLIKEID